MVGRLSEPDFPTPLPSLSLPNPHNHTQRGGPKPLCVDFVEGPQGYARRVNRFGLLYTAIGFSSGRPTVLDATAGLDARGIEFLRAIGAWAVETEAFIDWFRRGRPLRAAWGEAVG